MGLPFELAFEAPGGLLAAGAAAALGLGALAWRIGPKDPAIRALRLVSLALLALAVSQPVLVKVETSRKRPSVAVWVDASAWMGVEEDSKSRYDAALEWLGRARGPLEDAADVSYFRLGDRAERKSFTELSGRPDGPLRLERALRSAPGEKWDQVWLLSGGVGDLSEELDAALGAFETPVHVVGVGRVRQTKGVSLASARAPDFVFQHESFPVSVDWEAAGLAGRAVRLRLKFGSRTVAEATKTIGSGYETFTTSFTARAERLGTLEYQVEIEAPGATVARETFLVESIRQKLRVLYLCGRPGFEYSALREFLKSDPSNELVSFVILRNQENVSPVPESELSLIPFPAQEIFVQSLFDFDLFIFQDFAFWRFGLPPQYLESVKRFVERGGGLLLIAGDNAFGQGGYRGTPIEDLMPVALPPDGARFEPGTFRPVIKDPRHPLVRVEGGPSWDAAPPLDGHLNFGSARQGATVLATTPEGSPVFATRDFGRGRVFLSGAPSTWRWKLGAGLDWRFNGLYERFWDRAFHYLTGSLDLSRVRFAPVPSRLARPVVSLHVFDEAFRPLSSPALDVQVLRKDGARWEPLAVRESKPGVFQADVPPGRHELRGVARYQGKTWGEDRLDFSWAPPTARFAPLDEALLKKIATRTGGLYARLGEAEAGAWTSKLPAPKPVRRAASRSQVWASGLWLLPIALLWVAEWYLRRRKGYR